MGRARESRLERAQACPRSESPKSLQDHCCPVIVSLLTIVVTVPSSFLFFLPFSSSVFLSGGCDLVNAWHPVCHPDYGSLKCSGFAGVSWESGHRPQWLSEALVLYVWSLCDLATPRVTRTHAGRFSLGRVYSSRLTGLVWAWGIAGYGPCG